MRGLEGCPWGDGPGCGCGGEEGGRPPWEQESKHLDAVSVCAAKGVYRLVVVDRVEDGEKASPISVEFRRQDCSASQISRFKGYRV